MWPLIVVLLPPFFNLLSGIFQRQEPVLIQALLADSSIERLDECVVSWLPWPGEVDLDAVHVSPLVKGLRGELSSVINSYRLRQTTFEGDSIQDLHDSLPSQAPINLDPGTNTAKVIDYRKKTNSLPVEELVVHEVH